MMVDTKTQQSDRRKAILAAAMKAFEARGYAATTMDAVADEAGVSKGSLYNYFRNKGDLFKQVFLETMAVEHAEVDRLAKADLSASEKLKKLLDFVFTRLESFTRSGRLVMELWATAARQRKEEDLAASLAEAHAYWRGHVRSVLTEGIERGEFGTHFEPAVAASLIWATINGIIVQSMFDKGAEIGAKSLDALKCGILAGLTAWSRDQPRD